MSKASVAIMKMVAKPNGLANCSFGSLIARPVIVGFSNANVSKKAAETIFMMNMWIFMVYGLT